MSVEQRKQGGDRTQPADEINREGARRYGEGVRENARAGDSDERARDAAKALDGPEGDALREAERAGKSRARRHA